MFRGSIRFQTPFIYALGFIGLFVVGGLTGLYLSAMATDVFLTDTYFVVAHFHYVMVGGTIMGFLGGLALLVAQDDRSNVQRLLGQDRRDDHLRGIQP